MDRQPSAPSCFSSDRSSTGLTRWPSSPVDVPGEDPQPDADLRGGQPGARRVQHGVGEVRDQPAQLLVEVGHRHGRGAQHRVAEQTDRLDGHGAAPRGGAGTAAAGRRPSLRSRRRLTRGPTGSTWTRTGGSLRADAHALHLARRARDSAAPAARGTRMTTAARRLGVVGRGPVTGDRHRAEHLGPRRQRQRRHAPTARSVGGPVSVASREAGGRCADCRSSSSRRGEAGRVPAHQRLQRRVATARRRPPPGRPRPRGPGQRRGVRASGAAPPPRRAGRCGPASARCRAAPRRRSRPPRPARRPGVATTTRRPGRRPWPAPGRRPRCAPAPAGTPGRAPRRSAARPATGARSPRPPQLGAAPRPAARRAAPAAGRRPVRGGQPRAGRCRPGSAPGCGSVSQARRWRSPAAGVCTSTGPVRERRRGSRRSAVRGSRARAGVRVALPARGRWRR